MPPSLVQERAKGRHEAALSSLSATVRDINQNEDTRSSATLAELETLLCHSNAVSDEILAAEHSRIDAHKAHLEEQSFAVLEGDEVALLQDEFHVDGLDSVHSRERIAVRRREELFRGAFATFEGYTERMLAIDAASETLIGIEKTRKRQIQRALDELGSAVSAAAFVHETSLQVTVQRATHAVNKQLLANQSSISTYISEARQTEILQQRSRLQFVASLYTELLESIKHSFLVHTLQFIESEPFMYPSHRETLLRDAQRRHAGIHSDVGHALTGLTSLAKGLLEVRTSSPLAEICGGTKDSGWLRFFNDDFHLPVFSAPVVTVAIEWETFLTVILNSTRVSNVSLLGDVQQGESRVLARAEDARAILIEQLHNLYEATETEEDLVSRCSLNEEFNFPLHSLLNQRQKSENVEQEVIDLLEEPFARLRSRSEVFTAKLKASMQLYESNLTERLLLGERSVVEYVHDGSSQLDTIASDIHGIIRKFWVVQEEETNDYFDNKSSLEAAFSQCSQRLTDAHSEEEAGSLYVQGMEVLDSIEELYHTYHSNCIDPMEPMMNSLRAAVARNREALFELLRVEMVHGSYISYSNPCWRLREQPVQAVIKEAPVVEAVPAKKGKPGKKASSTPVEQPLVVTSVVVPLTPIPWLEEEDSYDETGFDNIIRMAFFKDCYISEQDVSQYLSVLRERMVHWLQQVEDRCIAAAESFCTERKSNLDTVVNEFVRQHQRRPPAFQSTVYEGRIRELQQTHQSQQQAHEALKKTLAAVGAQVRGMCKASQEHMDADHEALMSLVDKVPSQSSKDALDVHTRRFHHQADKVRETITQRRGLLFAKLEELYALFQRECDNADGRHTDRAMSEKIMNLREEGEELQDTLSSEIEAEIEEEEELCADVCSGYQAAESTSVAELEFLTSLSGLLASLKGRVSALMLSSSNDLKELTSLVKSLEGVLGESSGGSSSQLLLKDLHPDSPQEGVDALAAKHNEDLSMRLRKVQTSLGATFQDSRAERLLMGFVRLRPPLLRVGSQLGCLRNGVELAEFPSGCLVNPSKELSDGLTWSQPVISVVPTKSRTAKSRDSPSKGSPPPQPQAHQYSQLSFTVDEDGVAVPKIQTITPETCFADVVQAMATSTKSEVALHLQDYFSTSGQSKLMRAQVYGATSAQILASCSERVDEQVRRIATHCTQESGQYRSLVFRTQVASVEGADVMLKSLVRSCMDSLGQKLSHVLGVFEGYHASFEVARKLHNSRLKGSLAFPSNRPELIALTTAEQQRQSLSKSLVTTMWGVTQREAQNEATRASVRLSSAFMFYAWAQIGLITPAHVIPGDALIEGRHRGLRRLLMKSEKAASVPLAAPEEVKVEAPPMGKKSSPKGKDDKKSSRKATSSPAAEVPPVVDTLPLLVRPTCVYAGVRLGLVPVLTEFAAIHPEVVAALVDHYLPPLDWANEPAREEDTAASVSPVPSQSQQQKGQSNKKAATEPQQPPPPAAPVLVKVRAPTDEPIQRAYSARSVLIATLTKNIVNVAQECNDHFADLLAAEEAWSVSWGQGVAKLKSP